MIYHFQGPWFPLKKSSSGLNFQVSLVIWYLTYGCSLGIRMRILIRIRMFYHFYFMFQWWVFASTVKLPLFCIFFFIKHAIINRKNGHNFLHLFPRWDVGHFVSPLESGLVLLLALTNWIWLRTIVQILNQDLQRSCRFYFCCFSEPLFSFYVWKPGLPFSVMRYIHDPCYPRLQPPCWQVCQWGHHPCTNWEYQLIYEQAQ